MGVTGWRKGGFQINQFSVSLCLPTAPLVCLMPLNVSIQGSYHGYSSDRFLFVVKHDGQTGLSNLKGDLAASSGVFWSSIKGCILYNSPGSGVISLSGISSTSFTPFSPHLPRRLRRIQLLTSPPLMPFSIDHYPPLPSPLLAIAQSETPASPWSLLCGRCSWEVKRLRLGERSAVYFDVIYGVHMQFRVIGKFELPVMVIQM